MEESRCVVLVGCVWVHVVCVCVCVCVVFFRLFAGSLSTRNLIQTREQYPTFISPRQPNEGGEGEGGQQLLLPAEVDSFLSSSSSSSCTTDSESEHGEAAAAMHASGSIRSDGEEARHFARPYILQCISITFCCVVVRRCEL